MPGSLPGSTNISTMGMPNVPIATASALGGLSSGGTAGGNGAAPMQGNAAAVAQQQQQRVQQQQVAPDSLNTTT